MNDSRPEKSDQRSIPQLLSGTADLIENLRATLNSAIIYPSFDAKDYGIADIEPLV